MQHVFIIGSKGIPGAYGGYETFVDKLTEYHQGNTKIKYHVACKGTENGEFEYHNARCFQIKVPDVGSAQAIIYDVIALRKCCEYIEEHKIPHPVVYVLACRIGPFASYFRKRIHSLGGVMWTNPDGHEWKRGKWNWFIRQYWRLSERLMVKHTDLLVCDSKNIRRYIMQKYRKYHPNTTFIAYGSETGAAKYADDAPEVLEWYRQNRIVPGEYYMCCGRFVPENNYKTMIQEFMNSSSKRDFVLITGVTDKFLKQLKEETHFEQDPRIKFVGTVYNSDLLKKIRENAYAYLHGHEVGGTNPSLLEALGSTKVNLLLKVGFNTEVGEDGALYWTKEKGNLARLIDQADRMTAEERDRLGEKAKKRIQTEYTWNAIADQYEALFLKI